MDEADQNPPKPQVKPSNTEQPAQSSGPSVLKQRNPALSQQEAEEEYSQDFDRPSQIYTLDEVTPPLNVSTMKSQLADGLHGSAQLASKLPGPHELSVTNKQLSQASLDSQVFNQDGSPITDKKPLKTQRNQSPGPLTDQVDEDAEGGVQSAQFIIDPQRVTNPPSGLSMQSATLDAVPAQQAAARLQLLKAKQQERQAEESNLEEHIPESPTIDNMQQDVIEEQIEASFNEGTCTPQLGGEQSQKKANLNGLTQSLGSNQNIPEEIEQSQSYSEFGSEANQRTEGSHLKNQSKLSQKSKIPLKLQTIKPENITLADGNKNQAELGNLQPEQIEDKSDRHEPASLEKMEVPAEGQSEEQELPMTEQAPQKQAVPVSQQQRVQQEATEPGLSSTVPDKQQLVVPESDPVQRSQKEKRASYIPPFGVSDINDIHNSVQDSQDDSCPLPNDSPAKLYLGKGADLPPPDLSSIPENDENQQDFGNQLSEFVTASNPQALRQGKQRASQIPRLQGSSPHKQGIQHLQELQGDGQQQASNETPLEQAQPDTKTGARVEARSKLRQEEKVDMEAVSKLRQDNLMQSQKCIAAIDRVEEFIERVLKFKQDDLDLSTLKNFDKEAMEGNDILSQKRQEQDAAMDHFREIKKQIKFIYKTFESDTIYDWMVQTENKVKKDKQELVALKDENKALIKVYEKSIAAFNKSETEKEKRREVQEFKNEIQSLTDKLKKVRSHTRDVEDSTKQYHASIVGVEDRCRKMEEIIKFKKQSEKKDEAPITEEAVAELEAKYHGMLYEKEENQLQQESEMNARNEEILRVQKTIEALEKKLLDQKRELKMIDIDMQRLQSEGTRMGTLRLPRLAENSLKLVTGQTPQSVHPKVPYGGVNSRYGGLRNSQQKTSVSQSVDYTGVRHQRVQSIQTPASQHERGHGMGLEKYLEGQERSVAKSLVVGDATLSRGDYSQGRYQSLVPRSVRSKHLQGNKDINDVNLTIIPPPTSITQQRINQTRASKFSAKMSTQMGSEVGNRGNDLRKLNRPRRSISQQKVQ